MRLFLKYWLRRLWWWVTRRRVCIEYQMPIQRMPQSPQGRHEAGGFKVAIRRAIISARLPKPPKKRQRDIDAECLEAIKARRRQVA